MLCSGTHAYSSLSLPDSDDTGYDEEKVSRWYRGSTCSRFRDVFVGSRALFPPCQPNLPPGVPTWGEFPFTVSQPTHWRACLGRIPLYGESTYPLERLPGENSPLRWVNLPPCMPTWGEFPFTVSQPTPWRTYLGRIPLYGESTYHLACLPGENSPLRWVNLPPCMPTWGKLVLGPQRSVNRTVTSKRITHWIFSYAVQNTSLNQTCLIHCHNV